MDFSLSPRTEELSASMWDFMREHVFPAESVYPQWRAENPDHARPPVLDEAGWPGSTRSAARLRDAHVCRHAAVGCWPPIVPASRPCPRR